MPEHPYYIRTLKETDPEAHHRLSVMGGRISAAKHAPEKVAAMRIGRLAQAARLRAAKAALSAQVTPETTQENERAEP
jgi:hypothetical protein